MVRKLQLHRISAEERRRSYDYAERTMSSGASFWLGYVTINSRKSTAPIAMKPADLGASDIRTVGSNETKQKKRKQEKSAKRSRNIPFFFIVTRTCQCSTWAP